MKIINNMGRYFVFCLITITSCCGIAFTNGDRVLWLMILIISSYEFICGEVREARVNRQLKKYKKAYKEVTKKIEDKEL